MDNCCAWVIPKCLSTQSIDGILGAVGARRRGTMRYRKLVWRALRLRCPLCGEGKLFRGYWKSHAECSSCGVTFEREPGFFSGVDLLQLWVDGVHHRDCLSRAALHPSRRGDPAAMGKVSRSPSSFRCGSFAMPARCGQASTSSGTLARASSKRGRAVNEGAQ